MYMKNIERKIDSIYILYFFLFVMILMMFFVKDIHFEPIDFSFIKQIIHPEYPKGSLSYDPQYHYNYIVAFVAEWTGYKNRVEELAKIFWLIETGLSVLMLIKLSNLLFNGDKLASVIAVIVFMLLISGETEQKTMARPFYFLAVYYFLREKWMVSALFGAALFYIHVGFAIWWFLPSCFALAIKFLIYKKISLKQIINYSLVVTVLASPILYFYLGTSDNSGMDEFLIKYFYYTCWHCSSVVLTLSSEPMTLLSKLLIAAIFLMGYVKAKKSGYKNDNIMPIAIGVIILFILDFILADIFGNGTVITLQLLRSMLNIEIFSTLFFSFLFAKQIKNGNHIFFLVFLLITFYSVILNKISSNIKQEIALNVFYAVMLIYEIFEDHILHFMKRIRKTAKIKFNYSFLKRDVSKVNWALQHPVVVIVFLICLIVPKLPIFKFYMKSVFNISQHGDAILWNKNEYLFNDIARFTNEKITDKNVLLLAPFSDIDFSYYTKHKILMDSYTPIYNLSYGNKSSLNFKYILENDLHYSLEKLFNVEEFSPKNFINNWNEMWENMTEDTITRWKDKYGLTHVIRENELPLKFPVVYRNPFYSVYEIK